MFKIGENVVYGSHGVCSLAAVEQRTVDRKVTDYYVLEPLDQTGSRFYVPVHNPAAVAKMRTVISRENLEALLGSAETGSDCWIADENARKQHYRTLISSGDRAALLQMVCTLHRHKQRQFAAGRKFHQCDENFLRDAQRMLSAEFSLVLGIPLQEVGDYIKSRVIHE